MLLLGKSLQIAACHAGLNLLKVKACRTEAGGFKHLLDGIVGPLQNGRRFDLSECLIVRTSPRMIRSRNTVYLSGNLGR